MTILEIRQNSNGSHNDNTSNFIQPIPDGWAVLPEHLGTPETLPNYPFGNITVEEIDGVITVISWTPNPVPSIDAIEELASGTELENAFNELIAGL